MEHAINTTGHPVYIPNYKVLPGKFEILQKHMEIMHKADVIEPSNSTWNAPVILISKKDRKLQFCTDYCCLNQAIIKNKYPLPCINESLDVIRGAKYFTTLDLASGYWQVRIR